MNYLNKALPLLPALILFVIINLSSHAANAVFVSINCGYTGSSYKDENSIVWTRDDAYVQKKHESQVFQQYQYIDLEDWSNTVRVFPITSKENCYTIPIDQAGERLLVRASFHYWYFDDNTTTPAPTFELQFDGNHWATVVTGLYTSVSYEAIYVAKAKTTRICLAQTKDNQLPFISALEVRSLDFKMYSHVPSDHALLLAMNNRVTVGANQTVRYPADPYDRIWVAMGAYIRTATLSSEAVSIDTSSAQDNPPVAVLQNAGETTGTLVYLSLDTSGLPQENVGIYMIMYFSEVIRVDSANKRSIQVFIDGNPYSDPIVPPFGSVTTLYITNITASSNTSITLQATTDSTLPPLINAYELYTITGPPTQVTNTPDSPPTPPGPSPPDSTPSSLPPPRSLPRHSPNSPLLPDSTPPPGLQTPSSSDPNQNPNAIFSSSGSSKERSYKLQMILCVIIHISLLSFFYVQ